MNSNHVASIFFLAMLASSFQEINMLSNKKKSILHSMPYLYY